MREGVLRLLIVTALAVLISVPPAGAADINGDDRETILLPLAFFEPAQEIPGAHGTVWSGQVWLENRNDEHVRLFDYCGLPCPSWGPGQTMPLYNPVTFPPELGFVFRIRLDLARNMTFSNRIFERTLRSQPRGVDVPVVREGSFFDGPQTFLGIPAGTGVRTSLRVYDPWISFRSPRLPGPALEAVRVEVTDTDFNPLGTVTLRPVIHNPTNGSEDSHKPGFAAVYDLAIAFPGILAHEYVHIRVTPIPAGAQYWGMVSVTDNETQTVSIITAQ